MTWLAEWRAEHVSVGSMTIPRRYQQASFERITSKELRRCVTSYLKQFYLLADQGRAPVFLGQAGKGKSMAAAYIANRIYNGVPLAVEWQNCALWRTMIRTEPRETLAKLIKRLHDTPVVVLDDLHTITLQEPDAFAMLSGVLTERWDRCYPTLLVANLDLDVGYEWERLADLYTPALARRVREGSEGFAVLV